MKTRSEYMNGNITHEEYYSQFVTQHMVKLVAYEIGVKNIINSKDEHLNDIPLKRWDQMVYGISTHELKEKLKDAGDFLTLAGGVCILKQAAYQIIKGSNHVEYNVAVFPFYRIGKKGSQSFRDSNGFMLLWGEQTKEKAHKYILPKVAN